MESKLIFLILTCISGVNSSPVTPVRVGGQTSSCATTCAETNNFRYRPGKVYRYNYEAITRTGLPGEDNKASLKVSSKVNIEVISKCDLVLSLTETQLKRSHADAPSEFMLDSRSREFKRAVQAQNLRFSFQDGSIQEICPDVDDPVWVLNIKRGILSAFQNSMDRFQNDQSLTETDVSGECPTTYKLKTEGWRSITISKTKELNQCRDRYGFKSSFVSQMYSIPASIQSLPLMNSTQVCEQEIGSDGTLSSASCHERHLFKPFSNNQNGATTETIQTLQLEQEMNSQLSLLPTITERSTLIFHHDAGEKTEMGDNSKAIVLLRVLCESTVTDIRQDTPALFSQLVQELKFLDKSSLDQVYNAVQRRNFCPNNEERLKKFYMDAIPMVGSSAAIEQITDRIISNEVTGFFVDAWLTSLAFVQKPTTQMLAATKRLLEMPHGEKMIMPVSAMVFTFCHTSHDCFSVLEVQEIMTILQNNLGNDCSTNEANYMQVLMSLRAIGNIGLNDNDGNILELCMNREENKMEIRLAAIEAFRKMPCDADRGDLLRLLQNNVNDAEIRIAAYLQLMKCASSSTLDEVLRVLASEQVQQVGSFMWTHLTNLQETSDPLKQDVRAMLENIEIKKVFDLDKRQFSRNYELSYFSEKYNLVGTMDGNLIWSPKSFVPRSAMLNLTAGVFGHSFNLLEIGGRAEGTANLLEKYFGPSGIYNKDRAETPAPAESSSSSLKMKKINRIDEQMRVAREEFEASMYVRIFGNEVKYFNTHQINPALGQSSQPFDFSSILRDLSKNGEKTYTYSRTFLDSTLIIPTAVGLPLNLTLNATLSTDLKITGNMNVADPKTRVLLEGSIQPSGAVEVDSSMSVDAFVVRSGMKMVSTLHTSTAVSGKLLLDDRSAFTLEMDYPKQTSEIINFSNKLFIVEGETFTEHTAPSDSLVNINLCSGNTLSRVTGVELCGQVRMPNTSLSMAAPRWPLLGPANVSITLTKRDLPTGYKILYRNSNNDQQNEFHLSFDTPGSRTSRRISTNMNLNRRQMALLFEFSSPWKDAKLTGNILNDKRTKGLEGHLEFDGNRKASVVAKVRINDRGNTVTFTPELEIFERNYVNINMSGSIEHRNGKYLKFSLLGRENIRESNDPITVTGNILFPTDRKVIKIEYSHTEGQKYVIDGTQQTRTKSNKAAKHQTRIKVLSPTSTLMQVTSTVNTRDDFVGFSVKVDKVTKVPMIFKGRFRQRDLKNDRSIYNIQFRYKGPKKSDLAIRTTIDKKPVGAQLSTTVNYNFLRFLNNAKDSMTLSCKTSWDKNNYANVRVNTHFRSSTFGDFNHKITARTNFRAKKYASFEVILDHGKKYIHKDNKQRLGLKADAEYNFRSVKNARVKYNVQYTYPIQRSKFIIEGEHSHNPSRFNTSLAILDNRNRIFDVSILLNDKNTRDRLDYEGAASINVDGWRYVKVNADISQPNDNEYVAVFSEQHDRKKINSLTVNFNAHESSKEIRTSLLLHDKRQYIADVYYNNPRRTAHEINTRLRWHDGASFSSEFMVDINGTNPQAQLSFSVGKNNYRMAVSGANEREYRSISTDFEYPSRLIAVELGLGKRHNTYQFITDLQWDVKHQPDSRIMFEGTYRNEGYHDFRSSVKVQFLQKVYGALIEHVNRDKYITRSEVQWARDKKIGAEFELLHNHGHLFRNFIGIVGIATPFAHLDHTRLAVKYDNNMNKISSLLNFTFNGGKVIAVGIEGKKPFDIGLLDLKLLLELPIRQNSKSSLHIQNNWSETTQIGRIMLHWANNQEFIEIETNGQFTKTNLFYRDVRNIGMISSIRGFERVKFNITSNFYDRQMDSHAVYNQNGYIYQYNLNMDWNRNWRRKLFQNQGVFNITSDKDHLQMTWSHENTDHSLDTKTSISWKNGQMFEAALAGNLKTSPTTEVLGKLNLLIPSNEVRNVEATLNYNQRQGNIQNALSLLVDRQNVCNLLLDYSRRLGSADATVALTSKYMKNDVNIRVNSQYGLPSKRNEFEIEWAPGQRINMVSNYQTNPGSPNSKLDLTILSPFRQAPRIHITGERNMENYIMNNIFSVEFAPRQVITVENHLTFVSCCNIDNFVLPRLKITTPFPQMPLFDAGVTWSGHLNDFQTGVLLEVVPYVPRHDVSLSWLLKDRISGVLDIKNAQFSYVLAEIKSNALANTRRSEFKLMFVHNRQPKNVQIVSNVDMTAEHMDGDLTVTSSFTDPITIKYRHNTDVTAFNNHAHISYSRNKNVTVDLEFGNTNKVYGLLKLHTPYRGTEEVELGFEHAGSDWNDFSTLGYYGANKKRIEIKTDVDLVRRTSLLFQLKVPFKQFQLARFAYMGDNIFNHKSDIEVAARDRRVKAESSLQHVEGETLFTSKLETPFTILQSAEFIARRESSPESFALYLQTKRNSDHINAALTLTNSAFRKSLVSEVKSNLFEDRSLTIASEGTSLPRMRGQVIGMIGDKKMEFSLSAQEKLDGYDLDFVMNRLNVPALQNFEATVRIQGKDSQQISSVTVLKYGGKELTVNHRSSIGSTIEGNVEFVYPYEGRRIALILSHNDNPATGIIRSGLRLSRDQDTAISVDINLEYLRNYSVHVQDQFVTAGSDFVAAVSTLSPGSIRVILNGHVDADQFENNLNITLKDQEFKSHVELKNNFRNMEDLVIDVTGRPSGTGVQVKYGVKEYNAKATHVYHGNTIDAVAELKGTDINDFHSVFLQRFGPDGYLWSLKSNYGTDYSAVFENSADVVDDIAFDSKLDVHWNTVRHRYLLTYQLKDEEHKTALVLSSGDKSVKAKVSAMAPVRSNFRMEADLVVINNGRQKHTFEVTHRFVDNNWTLQAGLDIQDIFNGNLDLSANASEWKKLNSRMSYNHVLSQYSELDQNIEASFNIDLNDNTDSFKGNLELMASNHIDLEVNAEADLTRGSASNGVSSTLAVSERNSARSFVLRHENTFSRQDFYMGEKLQVFYNNDEIWRHSVEVQVQQNLIRLNASVENPQFEHEISFHTGGRNGYAFQCACIWNKNHPESYLRINGSASDFENNIPRNLEILITHPSRSVKVEVRSDSWGSYVPDSFLIDLDVATGQRFGFTKWTNLTMIKKGKTLAHLNVFTPWRSVLLELEAERISMIKLRVYWDADRNRDKKVELGVILHPSVAAISVTFPLGQTTKVFSIRDEVTSRAGNYRNLIEVVYSSDASKKIEFITDLKLDQGDSYNHTFQFSVTHRYSQTDLTLDAHVADIVNGRKSAGIVVNSNNKMYQLMADVNALEKSSEFYTVNPRGSLGIRQSFGSGNPTEIRIKGMFDLEDKIDVKATIDEERRSLHFEFQYDPEHRTRTLHLMAEYPDNVNFNMEIYRTGDFPRASEAKIQAQLKSSRELYTKIDWNPQAIVDFMTYNAEMVRHNGGLVSNHIQQSLNLIGRDINDKYSAFATDFNTEFVMLSQELAEELEAVSSMIRSMRRQVRKMHRNNELYLKDISEATEAVVNQRLAQIQVHAAAVKRHYDDMHNKFVEISNRIQEYPLRQNYQEFTQMTQVRMEEFKTQMTDYLNNQGTALKRSLEEQVENIVQLIGNGTDALTSVVLSFLNSSEINLDAISTLLRESPYWSVSGDIRGALRELGNAMRRSIPQVTRDDLKNISESIKNKILTEFSDVLQNPSFQSMSKLLTDMFSQMDWVMKEWDMSFDLYNLTSDLVNSTENFIRNDIGRLQILNLHRNRILVFDPENGHIEMELYLPGPVTSIRRLPSIQLKKYFDRLDNIAKRFYYLATDFSVWDLYYKYRIYTSPSMWIPPFDGVATIGSSQHFMTFDGQHFDFAGMCSYILVQDVMDDNFTVIVNYNRNRQSPKIRSLLVLAEGQGIEIQENYKVKVNNRPHELPYVHGELKVTRMGNHIVLDSGRGLIIHGNMEQDIFMIVISGYYHNKVAGLLGSFDNEPYNDIMTSNGALTSDLDNYGDSWEVNRRCKSGVNIVDQPDDENIETISGYSECAALFKDNLSPFRPCFRQVIPTEYLHMCAHNMRAGERDTCKIASLYTMRCRKEGVSIWMPQQCISCQSPNNEEFRAGETIKLSPSSDDYNVPKSADIVFVVESRRCVRGTAEQLGSLVYEVETLLTSGAINNNRYGLMSYSKHGAHSHTFQGEIFNSAREFAKGVESLVYTEETIDVHKALISAANYPFRTGVSKAIVLVQCGACGSPEHFTHVSYIKHLLNTRDITLHILRNQVLHVDDNKSAPTLVSGMDQSNVFTIDPTPSNIDINTLTRPDDSCASMAFYSNGSLFDTTNLPSSPMRDRNLYSRMVGRRIVDTARPHECQVCQCVADETGAAKSVCRKCMSSISEYFPEMWTTVKHPQAILDEFESQYREYIEDVRSI